MGANSGADASMAFLAFPFMWLAGVAEALAGSESMKEGLFGVLRTSASSCLGCMVYFILILGFLEFTWNF